MRTVIAAPPAPDGGGGPARSAPRIVGLVVLLLALLFVLDQSFIVVQAGERAVIFSKRSGVLPEQLAEGFHFNLPVLWVPTKYDIKTLTYTMSGSRSEGGNREATHDGQVPDDALIALTSDGLPVILDLSVRFHIDPDNVWHLHRDIGADFVDKVVRPQARSITRTVFAEFPVVDVYSGKRQAIVERIQSELSARMRANYLLLDEVLLRDIRFPPEFQSAIEQKQVAQQQAQQMIYEIDRAESEKKQRILEAQGEAGAIKAKADALAKNPQLVQYEYIKRLPADAKVVVSDDRMIVNLGDLLGNGTSADRQKGR